MRSLQKLPLLPGRTQVWGGILGIFGYCVLDINTHTRGHQAWAVSLDPRDQPVLNIISSKAEDSGENSIWRCPLSHRKRLSLIQIFSPPWFTANPKAALTHPWGWGSSAGDTPSQLSQLEPSSPGKGPGWWWWWSFPGSELPAQSAQDSWVPWAKDEEQSRLGSVADTSGFQSDCAPYCYLAKLESLKARHPPPGLLGGWTPASCQA